MRRERVSILRGRSQRNVEEKHHQKRHFCGWQRLKHQKTRVNRGNEGVMEELQEEDKGISDGECIRYMVNDELHLPCDGIWRCFEDYSFFFYIFTWLFNH